MTRDHPQYEDFQDDREARRSLREPCDECDEFPCECEEQREEGGEG